MCHERIGNRGRVRIFTISLECSRESMGGKVVCPF
jgi:hypothetical protein